MAFPSRYKTVTMADRMRRARDEATSVKSSFEDFVRVAADVSISSAKLLNLTGGLARLKMEVGPIMTQEGMEAYAQQELGRGIVADAELVVAKIEECFLTLRRLIPQTPDSFLKLIWWDVDGTPGWKAFTPQELAPLRLKIQELTELIE